MDDGGAATNGSRFAPMGRLTALALALPALFGAVPQPTAAATARSAVERHDYHGGRRDIDLGIGHGGSRFIHRTVGRGLAGFAIPAASDTIVVAARDLPRGTVLRAADIEVVVTDGETAASVVAKSANSINDLPTAGWVVRRLVHKGEPLRAPAVAPPVLIPAGSPVSLVWEVGELRVTRTGTAVGAAYAGETVTVRVDAKRRFTGIAKAAGTVVVSQP